MFLSFSLPHIYNRLLIAVVLCLSAASCSREVPVLTGDTMGTTYSVIVPQLKASDHEALRAAVEAALLRVNSAMSTWQGDSAISLFNEDTGTDWVEVPADFTIVAAAAVELASASGGAFDPTVGPLVKRWGFGKGQSDELPTAEEVTAIVQRVGYRHLQVDTDNNALKKSRGDLQIDLNAIAKGYGVDLLAAEVEAFGYSNYLVEIGGELRVKGRNADNDPWRIGVERPAVDVTKLAADSPSLGLLLESGGVATSGDYRNAFETDGVRYSHIIDPRSGYPVSHGLASVTVVANTTMQADAWATALLVLGPDEGLALAEKHRVASYFIVRESQGFQTFASTEFAKIALSD